MVTCDDIEFAPDLVADYPDIGDACLEIIEKGGDRFARLELEVLREGWKTLLVHYKLRDGGWSSPREVTPPEEWRASLSGTDVEVKDIPKGQILNVYIREGRWEMAWADLEAETLPVTFGPVVHEVAPEEAPAAAPAHGTRSTNHSSAARRTPRVRSKPVSRASISWGRQSP